MWIDAALECKAQEDKAENNVRASRYENQELKLRKALRAVIGDCEKEAITVIENNIVVLHLGRLRIENHLVSVLGVDTYYVNWECTVCGHKRFKTIDRLMGNLSGQELIKAKTESENHRKECIRKLITPDVRPRRRKFLGVF